MRNRKSGNEPIVFHDERIGFTIGDFWSWNSSDLLDNLLRGQYCEFIVAVSLGLDMSVVRRNWDPWDLTYPYVWTLGNDKHDEIRVEVKSSSYLQTWEQNKLSNISFGIYPARAWSPENGYSEVVKRWSDVYVFCLYTETDLTNANPMELADWVFYIVPTRKINEFCGNQKTITLSSLEKLDPIKTDFRGIRDAVHKCVKAD